MIGLLILVLGLIGVMGTFINDMEEGAEKNQNKEERRKLEAERAHAEKLAKIEAQRKKEAAELAARREQERSEAKAKDQEKLERQQREDAREKQYVHIVHAGTEAWGIFLGFRDELKQYFRLFTLEIRQRLEGIAAIFDKVSERKTWRLLYIALVPICLIFDAVILNSLFSLLSASGYISEGIGAAAARILIPALLMAVELVLGGNKGKLGSLLALLAKYYAIVIALLSVIAHFYLNIIDLSDLADLGFWLIAFSLGVFSFLTHSLPLEKARDIIDSYAWVYWSFRRRGVIRQERKARKAWAAVFVAVQKWASMFEENEEVPMDTLPLIIRKGLDWYSNDRNNDDLLAEIANEIQPIDSGDGAASRELPTLQVNES